MTRYRFSNKAVSIILVVALTAPAVTCIAINLYLDPFEIFSIDQKNPGILLGGRGKDRYQHAGTLRQHKPKSLIVGNSYAANFLPSQLESSLRWNKVYSITLDGSSLYEQSRVLDFGLRQSEIEQVLWLVAPVIFSAPHNYIYPKLPFPDYLYNTVHIDDLQLYATLPGKIREYSKERTEKKEKIQRESSQLGSPIDPRDRSTEWYSLHHKKFGRANYVASRIFKKARVNQDDIAPLLTTQPLSKVDIRSATITSNRQINVNQNLFHNILRLVKMHPQVEFTIVVHPPFPLLFWQYLKATSNTEYLDQILTIRTLVSELSAFSNVKTFGFGLISHTWNLAMYKDGSHYHPTVNADMAARIATDKNRLTQANIVEYLARFDAAVSEYRPSQAPRET